MKKNRAEDLAKKFLDPESGGPKEWAGDYNKVGADDLAKLDTTGWRVFGEVIRVASQVLKEHYPTAQNLKLWRSIFEEAQYDPPRDIKYHRPNCMCWSCTGIDPVDLLRRG